MSTSAPPDDKLPVVARLYYTGVARRYKRASVHPGPGEPLCFVSYAELLIDRARMKERMRMAPMVEAMRAARPYLAAAAEATGAAGDAARVHLKQLDDAIAAAESLPVGAG